MIAWNEHHGSFGKENPDFHGWAAGLSDVHEDEVQADG
jgi:hypothetical protein